MRIGTIVEFNNNIGYVKDIRTIYENGGQEDEVYVHVYKQKFKFRNIVNFWTINNPIEVWIRVSSLDKILEW